MVATATPATGDDAIPVNLAGARAALRDLAARTADLVAGIPDVTCPTRGLDWTLGETAAHLAIGARGWSSAVRGEAAWIEETLPATGGYRDRMSVMTARTLVTNPERDPATLGRSISAGVEEFLAASANRWALDRIPTPWYGDRASLPLGAFTCLLLGEQYIHGYDIARTLGRPWPIDRHLALLIVPAALTMMPLVVDPEKARGFTGAYALHLRGGSDFTIAFRDGAATVTPRGVRRQRVDCHLSSDPAAFVLVGFGRMSLASAIARGKMLAYGTRPWLGFSLRAMFLDP